VLDRPVVEERFQGACRPDRLADAMAALLANAGLRSWQKAAFREAVGLLDAGKPASARAAEAVLEYLNP
jgi:lipid A disaccharide synthetase